VVHFESKEAALDRHDRAIIAAVAELTKAHPAAKIELHGYTDSTGPDQFNTYLSKSRANAAKQALMKAGVAARKIMVLGHGELHPVATNATPAGRAKNRRIEIAITK
jgi:OOP family OmpA-OmpF porin